MDAYKSGDLQDNPSGMSRKTKAPAHDSSCRDHVRTHATPNPTRNRKYVASSHTPAPLQHCVQEPKMQRNRKKRMELRNFHGEMQGPLGSIMGISRALLTMAQEYIQTVV